MIEKTITIDSIEPVEIYGVNDVKLNVIKKFFPKLKIVLAKYFDCFGENLETALALPVDTSLLKGRSNYLCLFFLALALFNFSFIIGYQKVL